MKEQFDYCVPTGTILKEYMVSRGITQKKLAELTDCSKRHISDVINSKVKFTEVLALKLEKVFEDVQAEFWIDLEMAFRLFNLRRKK